MIYSLLILKQEDPPAAHPYRILECYYSIDGIRTRVCEGAWKTLEEAQEAREKKTERRNG